MSAPVLFSTLCILSNERRHHGYKKKYLENVKWRIVWCTFKSLLEVTDQISDICKI